MQAATKELVAVVLLLEAGDEALLAQKVWHGRQVGVEHAGGRRMGPSSQAWQQERKAW